jgi:phosphatidylinositol kinase/protein kinase (PI-3  family)
MKYIDKTLVDPAAIWAFKHSFATQLGMNFLFCFILNIRDRSPQKFLFNRESARICLTEMRPQYAERYQERGIGVIEKYEMETFCEDCNLFMVAKPKQANGLFCSQCNKEETFKTEVPLRFTSNLQSFVPAFLSDGVLATSMGASALALHSRLDLLRPYLYLLFRDDLLAWWMNMKSQRPIPEHHQQQKERDSIPYLHQNIIRVTERLAFCAPTLPSTGIVTGSGNNTMNANQSPVDHRIHQLLEISRSHKRISHMNLIWMPFL